MMSLRIKNKYWYILWISILAGISPTMAQVDSSKFIYTRIDSYLKDTPEENLYLHISKPHYLTGETVWFRVFHYSVMNHKPIALSKVVYIELLNSFNETVLQTKLKINNSGGSGGIFLPTTLNSGRYTLVAYTKWMRNFDESQFFSSEIDIINPFKRLDLQSEITDDIDLQFFPEGGNLIDGIRSRVAFKAMDKSGKGIFFTGALIDGGDTIVWFTPNEMGIGSFELTPDASSSLEAIIHDENGKILKYPFPEVRKSGYSMKIEPVDDGFRVRIENAIKPREMIYLSGLSRNKFTYFQSKVFGNGRTDFIIPMDSLNEGINQFTLFTGKGIPVCERKIFHYPENSLEIKARVLNPNPGLRKPVEIELLTTDLSGTPLRSDLSISVYSTDPGIDNDQVSIDDYFWLLSELKGQVQNPEYYFDGKNEDRVKAMDDLMLSQGWSRYNITEMLDQDTPIQFIPEFTDQVITATVKEKETGVPVAGQVVTMSFTNHYAQLFADRSNDNGRLGFQTWNVFGNKDLIIEYPAKEGTEFQIELDPQFHKFETAPFNLPFFVSPEVESFLIDQSVNMQIENIFLPDQEVTYSGDTSSFYGIPDATYFLDDYTRFPVMEEVMREYVYGVNVRKEAGKFIFKVLNIPRNEIMKEGPLVLLDGVPVSEADRIMHIDPLNINRIDVVHRKYYYGTLDCNGIVAFYSYKSDLPDTKMDARVIREKFLGFQEKKTFYEPKYDTPESVSSRIPDFRNQLHWDPEVFTDHNGNGKILFYTSDKAGIFQIEIQGLAVNGLAGTFSGTIQVGE